MPVRQVLIGRLAHGIERGDPRGVRRGIGPRWKLPCGRRYPLNCAAGKRAPPRKVSLQKQPGVFYSVPTLTSSSCRSDCPKSGREILESISQGVSGSECPGSWLPARHVLGTVRVPHAHKVHLTGGIQPRAIRMNTEDIVAALRQLNEVENALARSKSAAHELDRERELGRLRRKIPQPYLEHYQQRRARGKPPLAAVVEGVCRSCFLQVPTGLMQELRSGNDVVACPHCGAFLYDPARVVGGNEQMEQKTNPMATAA